MGWVDDIPVEVKLCGGMLVIGTIARAIGERSELGGLAWLICLMLFVMSLGRWADYSDRKERGTHD